MTRLALAAAALALAAPALAQQQPRGFTLQATPAPSPLLPLPATPRQAARPPADGPVFEPAPTPDRDNTGPTGPRASNDPTLAPALFTRRNQYRGEGFSPGSTAQEEQERRVKPGAGFNLRMPLSPSLPGR